MKKICIVTISGGSNFGNRLQNYALQQILSENLGADVLTAKNLSSEIGKKVLRFRPVFAFFHSPFVTKLLLAVLKNGRLRKKAKFFRFDRKYIRFTPQSLERDRVPANFSDQFDLFVAGSDQIWNPGFSFNSSVEYLNFAPGHKKIAYAASFGVKELTDEQQLYTKKMLADFQHISVREVDALPILEKANRPDGVVVLDPTMLLTRHQWSQLEVAPGFLAKDKPYLLSYVLDTNNTAAREYAQKLCADNNWTLVDINDYSDYVRYGIGPEEFLYLIHHAAHVCTDSFHASVFSAIFHREVTVFSRGNMNSRITSLLHTLSGGKDMIWNEGKCAPDLDPDVVDTILESERRRSIEYLAHALELTIPER